MFDVCGLAEAVVYGMALKRLVATVAALGSFPPKKLKETGVARSHMVCSYGGFLEPFNGLVDHVADAETFFVCHRCGRPCLVELVYLEGMKNIIRTL